MKRILFLTTAPPEVVQEYVLEWSNGMLPEHLAKKGASVTVKRWTDEDIIPTIHDFDLVDFLWVEYYIQHSDAFRNFLEMVETSIQTSGRSPCMMNHVNLVRWNMDKKYLLDMQRAGFDIPRAEIVDATRFSVVELRQRLEEFQSLGSAVLKPSVSASSKNIRRIADTSALNLGDIQYLESCTKGCLQSSLLIQRFEPAIAAGEYSFVFIGQKLTHVVLKVPNSGEFRCQPRFGGQDSLKYVTEIEERALSKVKSIFDTLKTWFGTGPTGEMGYVRIDGLVTD